MRSFVAVWPDHQTRRALEALDLGPSPGLRLVPGAEWHVTLRFLGEVDGGLVPRLLAAVDQAVAGLGPVTAHVGPATAWLGAGVLQVPVRGLDELAGAVRQATATLVPLLPDEDRPFTGHLTLARARRRPSRTLRAALANRAVDAEFLVPGLSLMGSTLGTGRPRYEELGRVPLGRLTP